VGGDFPLFAFEACGQLIVFLRDADPFGVPALQIKKLHPSGHITNIGIWMIRRDLHPDFQLSAARQFSAGIELLFHLFFIRHVHADLICHGFPFS
jgi:hypothetical protein